MSWHILNSFVWIAFYKSRTTCLKTTLLTSVGWTLSHAPLTKKMPTEISIGKSDGRSSSVEVSSPLLTLTCVQLTKWFLSAHKPAPTKENFIYFNIPQFRLSCKQCVCFKILIKEQRYIFSH